MPAGLRPASESASQLMSQEQKLGTTASEHELNRTETFYIIRLHAFSKKYYFYFFQEIVFPRYSGPPDIYLWICTRRKTPLLILNRRRRRA